MTNINSMEDDEDTIAANAEVREVYDHILDGDGVRITNDIEERIKWCNERDSNNIAIFLRLGRTNELIIRNSKDSFFEGYDAPIRILYNNLKDSHEERDRVIADGLRRYLETH